MIDQNIDQNIDHNLLNQTDISILIAEDSPTQAASIRFFLENIGYTVVMCDDGQEALEWLQETENHIDIVISDIEMPRMDGYTLCTEIRSNEKLKEMPVILLTSLSEPFNIIKSLEAGANKFLVKPFDQTQLPEVIDELYINSQRQSSISEDGDVNLLFKGKNFLITAEKIQILNLLISSYEDSYYKNINLQELRTELETLNSELEEKVQVRTKVLQAKEKKFRTLLESSIDGIHIIDNDGALVHYSPSFLEMLGYDNDEALSLNIRDWEVEYTHEEINKVFLNLLEDKPLTIERIYGRKDGSQFDAEITTKQIKLEGKDYTYSSTRDVSKRKEIERELLKLSKAVEQSQNTIVIANLDGNIEYVNQAFTTTTGYTSDEAIGQNPSILQSGKTQESAYAEMWGKLTNGENWSGEFINQRKDGTEYIEAVKASPIFQPDGTISNYMAIKEDITEQKRAQEHIDYLAKYDVLTGLPNRSQLEELTAYAINLTDRYECMLSVMFLDIDHFKDINDTLGHHTGDLFLIEFSKRLRSVLRAADTVSRLSGDEFILLVSDVNEKGINQLAQKLLDVISQPFMIDDNELTVTASIGIAVYPTDGSNQEVLSKNADIAMYRAKSEGRNQYCFFTKEMQESTARNLILTNGLHHALERDEFHLVYQPQISVDDNRTIGAEALLRWTHPELGNLSPFEFIPLAEDSGLIISIGEWILRTAIKEAKRWMDLGLPPMVIAVNISSVQFRHSNLTEIIMKILDEIGLPPEYLEIELTEAVAMNNPQMAYSVMDKLNEHGVRMAIDDFGTGYSSLSYLKKFNVYKLKIDKSFIDDLVIDSEDRAIVGAIISMAHSLGLETIAEGVENIEQLNVLRELGCDEIQGYYFSKPLSAEAFEMFVQNEKKSDIDI